MRALIVALALSLAACGGGQGITGSNDDPFMEAFKEYAQEYADCLNLGTVKVRFNADSGETPHCGAMPGGNLITCHGPVPFANPTHEVCHLSGLGDEWEAELCAHELLTTCK